MFRRNRFCRLNLNARGLAGRHTFDPTTHQCACGAYERGHTPKRTPARPRAECQVCEGTWAVDGAGEMMHHGYKRPGHGFIEGDCAGVRHKPFPATDALEAWVTSLTAVIKAAEKRLAELPGLTELQVNVWTGQYSGRGQKVMVRHTVRPGDKHDPVWRPGKLNTPSWESAIKSERHEQERRIRWATGDRTRALARIEKGRAMAKAAAGGAA